jgi:hypothetical protein
MSARTNHEKRNADGKRLDFGGYPLYFDVTSGQQATVFKKEQAHDIGYSSDRLVSVNIPYEPGKWFKAKVRITNIEDGKVKCQGCLMIV